MGRKRDLKQFDQACAEAGLTENEQFEASDALHAEKKASGMQGHMSFGELLDWLRQWKEAHGS
jgi:hypothetical protein